MSDLQCAATFVFAVPGDAEQARALAAALHARNVAVVYSGDRPPERQAAEVLGEGLGAPTRAWEDLRGPEPDGEYDDAALRWTRALAELADEHRGETVLVLGPAPLLSHALSSLARNVSAAHGERRPLTGGDVAEMRADGDGWVLDSWTDEQPGT